MIVISAVKLQQLSELVELGAATFFEAYQIKDDNSDLTKYIQNAFTKDNIKKEWMSPYSIFFFIKIKGETAGYCKMRWDRTPGDLKESSLEIQRFYFLKKYWGKGLGKTLFDFCLAYSKQNNFKFIWLQVWSKNKRALNFYKKLGFEKFKETKFDFGTDLDYLMKLEI